MTFTRPGERLRPPERSAPPADAVLATLPLALVVIDDRGCIASVNGAAEVLLNASAATLNHRPFAMVVRLPEACLAGVYGDAIFAAYDCAIQTDRTGPLRVDLHAAPVSEAPGWRSVVLASSIGAQRVGQRFDRRDGSRSAIGAAAMLAHEIKNPLSGIRGAAQLLDRSVDAGGRELTTLIRAEVDRVATLIDQMEAFTDRRPLPVAPANIYAILDRARAMARAGFADRVEIRDAFDPSLPSVLVHHDSMVQVLLNLLKNAAEAVGGDGKGVIWLTTRFRHGVSVADGTDKRRPLPIELCVIDNGPGPPDDLVDHIFEPFVTSKTSGRGLGLALVDKLVRDNGGIVQFAREGDPPRSVFRLLLPRA
jgi:two-component system, NtrC family, nitrogen regulation sensor histidine kinase GlnL